jgi:NAD(P)-dependent dehydrogenase (short-subunit alcohol dehydrogenase family)
MRIADATVLVTEGSRGLGSALVEEAARRGAKRIYAGAHGPFVHDDRRVTPLTLDITNARQIRQAVEQIHALDILINNAGVSLKDAPRDSAALERLLAINLFSTYEVTHAFLPALLRSGGGIVNFLSLAPVAAASSDSLSWISNAATFSLSESLRALLTGQGVSVYAVLSNRSDAGGARKLELPRKSPASAARAILGGVEEGTEEIYPEPIWEASAELQRALGFSRSRSPSRARVRLYPYDRGTAASAMLRTR